MKGWHRVLDAEKLIHAERVTVEGRDIALFRHEGKIFALEDICSHEFSRLSEGEVWGGKVYCAKHGSAFDLETGHVGSLPATSPVESFPVKVEEGYIWILA